MLSVTITPEKTALLVLDIEDHTCNEEQRPHCLATVDCIVGLAEKARAAGMPVVYSLTPRGEPDAILPPLKPQPGDSIIQSNVNKFWKTDLEDILVRHGITTVIITGTAAHGAVLHTATAAGSRKMQVVLPVDGLSAKDLYTEQAAAQLLITGPATRRILAVTRSDMIAFP